MCAVLDSFHVHVHHVLRAPSAASFPLSKTLTLALTLIGCQSYLMILIL